MKNLRTRYVYRIVLAFSILVLIIIAYQLNAYPDYWNLRFVEFTTKRPGVQCFLQFNLCLYNFKDLGNYIYLRFISTNQLLGNSCLAVGSNQSQRSIYINSHHWLAVAERKASIARRPITRCHFFGKLKCSADPVKDFTICRHFSPLKKIRQYFLVQRFCSLMTCPDVA